VHRPINPLVSACAIVCLNGTHIVGKTTSVLVQQLIPDSRVFHAEKAGEMLMDIAPGLPPRTTSNIGRRWRPLAG